MLADQLTEAVADFGSTIVAILSIDRLRTQLLCLLGGRTQFGERADFLNRADADAIGLAQCPVDRPGIGYAHLGAVDQGRDIRWIGVAVTDERFGWRFTYGCPKYPPSFRRL